jgi:hypothetical protein
MAQNDLAIANANGATVRVDIQGALQALATQSSGATAPGTTYPFQMWADTTANVLKMRNAANSAWLVVGKNAGLVIVDVATAGTVDLGAATSFNVRLTGTTTITSFGSTATAGEVYVCRAAAAFTLTHNGTSLILPGAANITTAADDRFAMMALGSGNWLCLWYQRAAGSTVGADGTFTDIASATTTDIGAVASVNLRVTGTTTITGLGTIASGTRRKLRFAGVLTLTHNGTSLILPGAANITTAADDVAEAVSLGSGNWIVVSYQRASGRPIVSSITATAVATTSGSTIDITGIPAGVRRITLMFDGLSTNGASIPIFQIGDSGGIEATGYLAAAANFTGTPVFASQTTGFPLSGQWGSTQAISGHAVLTLIDTGQWVCSVIGGRTDAAAGISGGGGKTLSASPLDRVRLTTVGGTDTFDAGKLNYLLEF